MFWQYEQKQCQMYVEKVWEIVEYECLEKINKVLKEY